MYIVEFVIVEDGNASRRYRLVVKCCNVCYKS